MASSAWPSTWQEFIALQQEERIAATPLQLDALKLLFSDQSVPVSNVAKLITVDSIKAHEETPGASDSGLWRTLSDGIKQLTEYNDKFVELFYEIAKVPLHGATSTLLTAYWEWWTEWAFSFDDPPSVDPKREAARQGWLNINAFSAKVSRNRREFPLLNNLGRAAWVRDILEKKPWETYSQADFADLDEEDQAYQRELHDIKSLDGRVPAAAVWFTTDAQAIYELGGEIGDEYENEKTDFDGRGFSKKRFAFWRERFEWISGVEELAEKTKAAAKEAAAAMKKVEEANKTS
ncbi:hypothetical protein B0O99DRAFT_674755 [Bisporella sp. PMI_857]|nr:hypothetical protein B0O99DRAFT_674755 [Bisporella sp. PMI_857]